MNFYEECLYHQGYDQALLDIRNWLELHSEALKRNRLYNQKGLSMLMNAFLENRDTFRDYGQSTEFVLSNDRKKIFLDKSSLL